MSVTVNVPETSTAKTHEGGYSIRVVDGHLFVETESKFPIAVYAPGKWKGGVADAPTKGADAAGK
jgi:hypothetical protein